MSNRALPAVVLLVLAIGLGSIPAPAEAYQNPARTLAGPSAAVIDLGGAAMSPDGRTGGVVYRQRVGTRAHVFVAPYLDGRWRAPQQLDAGQAYDSSFPRIGAADGGRLVVTWVQAHGPYSDQLWAARLGTGSTRFDPRFVVDPNVGQASTTFPSLAVAPDGTAYVSYVGPRAQYDDNGQQIPPALSASGWLPLEYRLARILGTSAIGYPPLNRRPGALDPLPTTASAPQVAIDASGTGAVAWQEPDDQGIPRVWARRLFTRSVGSLQQVSPDTFGGHPLQAATDGFSLAMAGNGEGALVYRQLPIAGSGLAAPRLLLARLAGVRGGAPPSASRTFGTPQLADALGAAGAAVGGTLSAPQAAVSADGRVAIGFGLDQQVRLATGADTIRAGAGLGAASVTPVTPAVVVGRDGAAVLAWPQAAAGGTVAIQERPTTAAPRTGRASALLPGSVSAVTAAGSAGGDAIVAFQQGSAEAGQIGVAVVDAQPAAFAVDDVPDWLRRAAARISWQPPTAACGPVNYRVYVDGRLRVRTRAAEADIHASVPGDGIHHVRVIATDCHGQATATPVAAVAIDGTPPTVALAGGSRASGAGRRTLRAVFRDGARRVASGVDPSASTVDWGDGIVTTGARQSHTYAHPGLYRLVIVAVDHAGNRRTLVRQIGIDL